MQLSSLHTVVHMTLSEQARCLCANMYAMMLYGQLPGAASGVQRHVDSV